MVAPDDFVFARPVGASCTTARNRRKAHLQRPNLRRALRRADLKKELVTMQDSQQPSHKRERWIQIGKHRCRIANDHHAMLLRLSEEFRYVSMQELLFYTSLVGASVMQQANPARLINVRRGAV